MADKKAEKAIKAVKSTAKKIKTDVKEKRDAVKKQIAEKRAATPNRVTSNRLKLMITVVGRNKAEYYLDLIQSFNVNMQLVAMANGTANAKMLGLLGLSDNNEKAVILSFIQESKIPQAHAALEEKFNSIKDGKGISFTVPLTSVIGALIYGFLSDNKLMVKESK